MIKSITKINVKNKTILLRTGMDVQIKNGKILDNERIKQSLKTINYLVKKQAKIVIITHIGRPNKKDKNHTTKIVAKELSKLLKKPIKHVNDCVGKEVEKQIQKLKPKEILMLENLRFHKEELKNDNIFSKKLSKHADIYVNDAFSVSHKKQASTVAITKHLPSYSGMLLEEELKILTKLLKKPTKPFIVVLGGAKISNKIKTIQQLSKKADKILLGGAMPFPFMKKQKKSIGKTKIKIPIISKVPNKILLPKDFVLSNKKTVSVNKIPKNLGALDVGKETIQEFSTYIKKAKTILWNGPLGMFEEKAYSEGSKKISNEIQKSKAYTIIGGGETLTVTKKFKHNKFSIKILGGGAMLQFLSGEKMPGIEALKNRK